MREKSVIVPGSKPLMDIGNNKTHNIEELLEYERRKLLFERAKVKPYNEILLSDAKFKDMYSESLYEAIFTFPKF